jgi:diguanylate cyclase (GGDEF)-like protein
MNEHDLAVTVVGTDERCTAAASALATGGRLILRVDEPRQALQAGADCVICPPAHIPALAMARSRPAIVALVEDRSCAAAIAALEGGADECVDHDADGPALWRAASLAVARREAADRARRDPLTGTADRAVLYESLTHAMSTVADGPGTLAVLFVDLDDFKAVNDRFGHHVGDRVLVDVARRLQVSVRPNDLVARYGGDEFVVVCEHVGRGWARAIADRLTRRLSEPIGLDGLLVPLGASIGVATTRDKTLPPLRLIARADSDMYRIKNERRPALEAALR